ncbi:hypothetical protein ABTX15_32755 [Micromonospora sp. NPDC094482]|uniref:hypothetical protein n=1 Tax=unclassified Micromonospora TaxID=2617518 RepID=UPI00332A61F0
MSLRARMGIAALAILTTVSMTVGGAGVANASAGTSHAPGDPSAASYEVVPWYTFERTNSTWHCGATVDRPAFYEQVCTIVNGKSYQSALIFVPKVSAEWTAEVINVRNGTADGRRICAGGTLTAWVRIVCFAPTRTAKSGEYVYSYAFDPSFADLYGPVMRIS